MNTNALVLLYHREETIVPLRRYDRTTAKKLLYHSR